MTKDTLNFSIASDDGTPVVTGSQAEVGTQREWINKTFPASTTNSAIAIAFNASTYQSIALVASKDMTIKVNSTSSPIKTINLVAGAPFIWQRSLGYFENPFSADVTHFYVTCSAAATLKGKVLKA